MQPIDIGAQLYMLAQALALGAVSGALLCLFKIINRLGGGAVLRFFEDFFFIFFYFGALFWLLRIRADGQVRLFVLVAQAGGLVLYCKTVGKWLFVPFLKITEVFFGCCKKVFLLILWPFDFLGRQLKRLLQYLFVNILKKPFIFLKRYIIIKISAVLSKISLHPRRKKDKGDRFEHGKAETEKIDISQYFH